MPVGVAKAAAAAQKISDSGALPSSLQRSLLSAEALQSAGEPSLRVHARRRPQESLSLWQRLRLSLSGGATDLGNLTGFSKADFSADLESAHFDHHDESLGRQAKGPSFRESCDDYLSSRELSVGLESATDESLWMRWDPDYDAQSPAQALDKFEYQGSPLTGILFMCGAAFVNVASSCLVQTILSAPVSHGSPPCIPDFLLFRSLPSLVFQFVYAQCLSRQSLFSKNPVKQADRLFFYARILLPSITFSCTYFALQNIEISVYTVLFQTNPFLTSIGAFILLRTAVSKIEIAAMVSCFIAVIAIVINKSSTSSQQPDAENVVTDQTATILGLLVAFCAAICNSAVNVTTKKLAYVHWNFLNFHTALVPGLLWASFQLGHLLATGSSTVTSLTSDQLIMLGILGVSETFFLTLATLAFQNGQPSTIALFSYTNLLWAFVADVTIFSRPVVLGQLLPTLFITALTIGLGISNIACSTSSSQPGKLNSSLLCGK